MKENIVILLGFMISFYKERIYQFLDKIVAIVFRNFDQSRSSLQQSCARTLAEIYKELLREKGLEVKDKKLIGPLVQKLRDPKVDVQTTSALALYELLLAISKDERDEISFEYISKRILSIYPVRLKRTNPDAPSFRFKPEKAYECLNSPDFCLLSRTPVRRSLC